MTKRALIIGGGIAGTLTATALDQVGIEAVVCEAHEASSDGIGAFLTLAVNGLAALEPLGLSDVVAALGMETPAMRLVSGRTGKELGSFAMPARTVSRSDLYRALRSEAARRGVEVRYGKRLVDAVSSPSGVRATFADGTTAEGDLLIGADGLRSATRRLIDPKAPAARHVGLLNTGGYAHGLRLAGEPGVATFVFGRRCFFGYFIHPNGEVWWFANPASRHEPSREELAAITPQQWRDRLNDDFADDRGPMLDIIAATEHIVPAWNTYDFPRVPTWHSDRMIIIGDAAHATSPSAGQGASMAMEDAVMLARCLRDVPGTAAAFAAYTRLRRGRVERVVAAGKRNGTGKAAGPIGARIRDALLPVIMQRFATPQAQAWMHDYRIDFHTPVTGSLRGKSA
jgi:2-polyprenyl-6-methoxyphenol hydroxylase-like FAD-dependent oxidoreductase